MRISAFSLAVWRRGWKLLYDPAVLVYHYAGRPDKRAYSAVEKGMDPIEIQDAAFNMVSPCGTGFPFQRVAFVILVAVGRHPGRTGTGSGRSASCRGWEPNPGGVFLCPERTVLGLLADDLAARAGQIQDFGSRMLNATLSVPLRTEE